MRAALAALRKAERELAAATPDKGGHRVRAEDLIKQAIREVEEGINFDNRHWAVESRKRRRRGQA